MATSTVASANQVTRFQRETHKEYVRGGKFGPFISNSQNSVIVTNRDLKKHSIPLIAKLSGDGVTGSGTLVGNEESLLNYEYNMQPTYYRNGVLINDEDREKSEFDLFSEARPALGNWVMELKRDQIIQALGAIEAGGTYYNYGGSSGAFGSSAASAANMDTWNTNNQDRVLYGAALSNNTSGDHTASLDAIDTTADKLDAGIVSIARRMAENSAPLIHPYMMNGDTPWFVMFVGQWGFRDLKADTAIAQANREARPRAVRENPIFNAGDLLYDGVVIKEIPEIEKFVDGSAAGTWDAVWGSGATGDSLATGGNASSRVAPAFLCGAAAVGFCIGRNSKYARRKEDDYGHQSGVGVSCKHDIKKTFFNNKQHGMVTVFHSSEADS